MMVKEKTTSFNLSGFSGLLFFGLRLRSKISMGILTGNFHEVPTEQKHEKKTVIYTPETNSSPLKIGHPKRKLVFQPSIFRCELLVSGRVERKLWGRQAICPKHKNSANPFEKILVKWDDFSQIRVQNKIRPNHSGFTLPETPQTNKHYPWKILSFLGPLLRGELLVWEGFYDWYLIRQVCLQYWPII